MRQGKNELKRWTNNPVTFFQMVSGFLPTDYQRKILEDRGQFITIRAGRQTGKTEVVAAKILWECITSPKQFKVLILAPTARQSSIVYSKMMYYLARIPTLERQFILHKTQDYTQFNNGSEIYCLPGDNPETVRGYSPHLIVIDEAAFVKDRVYEAVEPSLATTNGSLILISTPFGKQGRFYDSHARIDYYHKYHIPWSDCPFVNKGFIEKEKSSKTEMEFKQEYEAEFIEEMDTFFPHSLVRDNIGSVQKSLVRQLGYDYYLGVDPARFGTDETVYVVLRYKKGEQIVPQYWESTSQKPSTDVEGRIRNLNSIFAFRKIFVEENGLGGPICDSLKEAGVKVEAFASTLEQKSKDYNNFKNLLEKKQIVLPDEPKLIWQMSELQYEVTSNGHFKIHHPDKQNAHDDWPDALCFAAKFMDFKAQGVFFVATHRTDEGELGFR